MKRILVNRHIIAVNVKNGTREAPLSVQQPGKTVRRAHHVRINGASVVTYSPDKPLSCGATVWITTTAEVELLDSHGWLRETISADKPKLRKPAKKLAKKRAPNQCPTCRKEPALPSHTCPYKEDINHDSESKCKCCDDCTEQCAWNI